MPTRPRNARIFVAEGHRLQREFLCRICSTEFGHSIAGEAGTVSETIRLLDQAESDLVILDMHLPGGDGLKVAGYVQERRPSTKILIVSSRSDYYTLQRVEHAHIEAFIDTQTQDIGALRAAIDALLGGLSSFAPVRLKATFFQTEENASLQKILSERECHILALIGASLSDAEIAARLGISQSTAQTHRSHIMRKTGMPNSLKLARFAILKGFYRLDADAEEIPV